VHTNKSLEGFQGDDVKKGAFDKAPSILKIHNPSSFPFPHNVYGGVHEIYGC